jgi:diadenosine tetraphosphatase ApaH/serine/threonine PP2A family protein phosphatase
VRACVISDVHGNLHALEAVLAAVAGEKADELWCLGDLVGYGPRPNACCRLVAERADVCLVGNHDFASLGRLSLDDFNDDAAESARWTASVLEEEPRTWLDSLPPASAREGIGLYHASPRDPVWEYVLSAEIAAASLRAANEPLVLVGHSHVALEFALDGARISGDLAGAGTELDLSGDERRLLNPGSVGQPRDGDARAAYLVLDLDAGRASFKRVHYDVERTQEELRARGLPEALAARLEHGL